MTPSLIDIGVNLTSDRFRHDREDALRRALEAGVDHCVVTGTSLDGSRQALRLCHELADEFPAMLTATAGVHPHGARDFTADTEAELRELISRDRQSGSPRIVAIGETGLDFNRNVSPPADQERAFERQLALAAELGLPAFLHERDAHQRQLAILKTHRDQLTDAVIHCFTGDRHSLYNYLDLDLSIGITGWVCDERRGGDLQRALGDIPLDKLMIETDAPYLLPRTLKPKPRGGRNEPAFLPQVLAGVAACRDEAAAVIADATRSNARRFFGLDRLH